MQVQESSRGTPGWEGAARRDRRRGGVDYRVTAAARHAGSPPRTPGRPGSGPRGPGPGPRGGGRPLSEARPRAGRPEAVSESELERPGLDRIKYRLGPRAPNRYRSSPSPGGPGAAAAVRIPTQQGTHQLGGGQGEPATRSLLAAATVASMSRPAALCEASGPRLGCFRPAVQVRPSPSESVRGLARADLPPPSPRRTARRTQCPDCGPSEPSDRPRPSPAARTGPVDPGPTSSLVARSRPA